MKGLVVGALKIYDKGHAIYAPGNEHNYVDESCLDDLTTKGDSKADVLIIVNHDILNINSEENVLLNKILEAVGLQMDKVFLIYQPTVNLHLIWRYLNVSKSFIFGVEPKMLGLHVNINIYEPLVYQNKVILLSDGVETLREQPDKKKLLWKALQNIFK